MINSLEAIRSVLLSGYWSFGHPEDLKPAIEGLQQLQPAVNLVMPKNQFKKSLNSFTLKPMLTARNTEWDYSLYFARRNYPPVFYIVSHCSHTVEAFCCKSHFLKCHQ